MSTTSAISGLDPRLHRLALRADDAERDADRISGLTSTSIQGGVAVTMTRILVQLATDTVPRLLANRGAARIAERIISVEVAIDELPAIAADPDVVFLEAGRVMYQSLDSSLAETRADRVHQPPIALDGAGVVVGIIDFGFDFTLADFRDANGATRVAFIWDQSLSPNANESSPAEFGFGVEYDAYAIDAALMAANPFAAVRHNPGVGSHGTHVAGIAAGNGRSSDAQFAAGTHVGAAPGATIIFVQPDTRGAAGSFTDSVSVANAIAYVFRRASQLRLPCVINMSLGQNGGSHDGESVVERAIDALCSEPGRAFVSAAGNEHVWRGHASGTLRPGDTRTLALKVGGGMPIGTGQLGTGVDTTPNEVEIWYSSRDQLRVTVRSPAGDLVGPVIPGVVESVHTAAGNRVVISSRRFTELNGDAQIYLEIAPGQTPGITSGTWEIVLEAVAVQGGRFDAWIERDARNRQNNFADQSFFSGPDFDPVMTLGTPATTRRGIAVANYDHRTATPEASSSRGTTRDGRLKPEVAAPGARIVSSCSLGGVGNTPVRVPMTGTSMSAPHVAGIAALMLQRNRRLTAAQISRILIASARLPAGLTGFDAAWGHGMVDAEAAVALVPLAGL